MSKLFEALKRLEGEQGSPVVPGLVEDGAVPAEAAEGATNGYAESLEQRETAAESETIASGQVGGQAAEIADMDIVSAAVSYGAVKPVLCDELIRSAPLRVAATAPVLPFDDTHRNASEQYRMIRTKVLQHPRKPCMVIVSSPGSGDGKSVTAINMAGVISLKSIARVLLVDGDLRRPAIHEHLGIAQTPGLGEVLEEKCSLEQALIRTEQSPSLYVLTAGERRANPAELLDSPQWRALCVRFRELFEYVVVDSPPIAAVADYDLIQEHCDGVLLVTRPDHTKRSLCFKAIQTVPKDRLIGVVVNCVDDWFLTKKAEDDAYYRYRSSR